MNESEDVTYRFLRSRHLWWLAAKAFWAGLTGWSYRKRSYSVEVKDGVETHIICVFKEVRRS